MMYSKTMGWRALLLSIPFYLLAACGPATQESTPPMTEESTSKDKMVVYQMMTRLFGNQKTANEPWGTLEQNGVGKFADINDKALSELKNFGVTHVWYTGAIEHGVLTDYTAHGIPLDDADVVKGRAGSPYAIKDYYDVNPDLAVEVPNRMAEFEALVQRTHAAGLKVLIDFVPNHVARGYNSDAKPDGVEDFGTGDNTDVFFDNQNNFYYLPGEAFQVPAGYQSLGEHDFPTKDGKFEEQPARVTGNDKVTATPDVNDWFETVKLNYGVNLRTGEKVFEPVPDTWIKMRDILSFWLAKGVDGFRCDMAEMVPAEFWGWAIPQIKDQNPDVIFIAEIYNPEAYSTYIDTARFDYLYDKVQLYDTLRHIVEGHGEVANIPAVMEALKPVDDQMLRFLENHDEQRIASPDFAGDPLKAWPAMVLSATIGNGPVMVYFGQEVGEPGAGAEGFGNDDGRTTIFDYWGVPEHQKWVNGGAFDGGQLSDEQKQLRAKYQRLLTLVNESTVFSQGTYRDLLAEQTDFPEDVYVYLRETEEEAWLIVANFGAEAKNNVIISLPDMPFGESQEEGMLVNRLNEGMQRPISITEATVTVSLSPYGAKVFRVK